MFIRVRKKALFHSPKNYSFYFQLVRSVRLKRHAPSHWVLGHLGSIRVTGGFVLPEDRSNILLEIVKKLLKMRFGKEELVKLVVSAEKKIPPVDVQSIERFKKSHLLEVTRWYLKTHSLEELGGVISRNQE